MNAIEILDKLLEGLVNYANDANPGPGTPDLPERDVKLRYLACKLREEVKKLNAYGQPVL